MSEIEVEFKGRAVAMAFKNPSSKYETPSKKAKKIWRSRISRKAGSSVGDGFGKKTSAVPQKTDKKKSKAA